MKRNRTSRYLVLTGVVLLLLPFAGCKKKEQQKLISPMPQHPVQVKPVVAPAPAPQQQLSSATRVPAQVTQLDFRNRTDPFKAYAVVEPAPVTEQPTARRETDLLPIQSVDVSKFRLVGIVAGLAENRALVIDPSGKGYVVQQGMPLGSNDGRITRITPSTVEVMEIYKEGRGQVKKRKVVLTLAKKR